PATTTASPPWPPTRSGAGCLPSIRPRLPTSTLPPYTTLFRSHADLPQHVDPPDQLSRPTCRPARVGRSSEIEHLLRLDDPRRKNRLFALPRMRSKRLTKTPTGLARRHDQQCVGQVEDAVAAPTLDEPFDRHRRQRTVPREDAQGRFSHYARDPMPPPGPVQSKKKPRGAAALAGRKKVGCRPR